MYRVRFDEDGVTFDVQATDTRSYKILNMWKGVSYNAKAYQVPMTLHARGLRRGFA
eukprot:SAG31_NODE_25364_length_462_cov_1.796143_1_plen_55_part_10